MANFSRRLGRRALQKVEGVLEMNMTHWRKVESAAVGALYEVGVLYEVCGDSGMKTYRWFVATAYVGEDGSWYNEQHDRLSEQYPKDPLYYRHLSYFPKRDPA